jgi:hypothetical protein
MGKMTQLNNNYSASRSWKNKDAIQWISRYISE